MNEMSCIIKFISIWKTEKLNITIFPAGGLTQLRSPAGLPALPAGFHVSTTETAVLVSLWEYTLTFSLKIRNPDFQLDGLQATRSLGLTASLVSKYWWVRCIPRSATWRMEGIWGISRKLHQRRGECLFYPLWRRSEIGDHREHWLRDTPLGRLTGAQERPRCLMAVQPELLPWKAPS